MASDRGTLTRSGLSVDQQGAWGEPTAASNRRMPSAQRERKPALFALAILLVALGAGAAGLLVIRASAQVQAIEVVQSVNQNSQIPAGAMEEIGIPSGSALNYVAWSNVAEVEKDFAAETIPAGTLLTAKMVSGSDTSATGQDRVGLSLKAGQVPTTLEPGDMVEAFAVGTSCGATPGQVLAQQAQVTDVNGSVSATGSTEVVTVAVQPGNVQGMTCSAANGNVGLALLPSNG
jgi:hypothetical protein